MTDKEIIIDGVNVAGCQFLKSNTFCRKEGYYEDCKDKNCIYKQLCRKEQECEKLREANDEKNEFLQKLGISATGEFHRIKHYIDKLHQEYEELKEELSTYKKMLDNSEVRLALTDVRTGERDVWRKLGNKADRYKRALEKIEGIADNAINSEYATKGPFYSEGMARIGHYLKEIIDELK